MLPEGWMSPPRAGGANLRVTLVDPHDGPQCRGQAGRSRARRQRLAFRSRSMRTNATVKMVIARLRVERARLPRSQRRSTGPGGHRSSASFAPTSKASRTPRNRAAFTGDDRRLGASPAAIRARPSGKAKGRRECLFGREARILPHLSLRDGQPHVRTSDPTRPTGAQFLVQGDRRHDRPQHDVGRVRAIDRVASGRSRDEIVQLARRRQQVPDARWIAARREALEVIDAAAAWPYHSPFFSHSCSGIGSPILNEKACTFMWSAVVSQANEN